MYLAPLFAAVPTARQTSISPKPLIKAADYPSADERGLERIADRPVFLSWGVKDFAFQEAGAAAVRGDFPRP